MSEARRLTLGALYREMRNGLADSGLARVSIEFQQRSTTAPATGGEPAVLGELVLGADLDYDDSVLQRAALWLGRAALPPDATFSLQRHGQGYAYSLDGETWGRFTARPQIFDLAEFEQELHHIPIRDATIDQALEARQLNEAIDIDLDHDGFERLLRIFAADREDDAEDLDLSAFSVTIAGAEDVSMLYWWSLTGVERESGASGAEPHARKVTCSVTIKLSPLAALERRKLKFDKGLAEVAHVDEVWALIRGGGVPAEAQVSAPPD